MSGDAAGELAFGEEVLEGDTTRGEDARSSEEDTRIVGEDSEAESVVERSLGDCEDMIVSARGRSLYLDEQLIYAHCGPRNDCLNC